MGGPDDTPDAPPDDVAADHPLVGQWAPPDEGDSNVRFTVRARGARLEVVAVDAFDGEEMEVADTRLDGGALRFATVTPSTGVRLEHALEALPDGRARYSVTIAQTWLKVPEDDDLPPE